ncbi:MAG: Coenzyme F420 hydrogenase/dehydrogenase, beta subunit C-terminal domain [Thermomicrobiales bacterium]
MSAAFAIRDEMNDIAEAPGKVWFWELERAVIDAGRCVQCGVCVAACPSDSLGIGPDDLPKLVKMCTGCSLCWDFCPRGGLRYETLGAILEGGVGERGKGGKGEGSQESQVGSRESRVRSQESAAGNGETCSKHREHANGHSPFPLPLSPTPRSALPTPDSRLPTSRLTARVADPLPGVQDGGVVSALLIALLEAGEIDGALVAKPSEREPWKGVAHLAQTPEDVIACAGSFYNQTLALGHLDLKKYTLPKHPRIALVGTPCEIQGLRAMQARPFYWGASQVDAVVLTVALLCTKSFHYEQLMVREIQERRQIGLAEIAKIDIIRGKLYLYGHEGEMLLEEPIRDFHGAALKGCDECADFLGVAADISVGSVGSADGYSSVLLWNDVGQHAFQRVGSRLEIRDLDKPQAIEKLAALDLKVALETLPRPYDPHGNLFISYDEHLSHYAGTDRAPVTHEPVRY